MEELAIVKKDDRSSLAANTNDIGIATCRIAIQDRDNNLFQTARLVRSSLYINIISNDYVSTTLDLYRVDLT